MWNVGGNGRFYTILTRYRVRTERGQVSSLCIIIVTTKQHQPLSQIAVGTSQKGFQQVSFVNSIATTKGGTHVDMVTSQVVAKVQAACQKKVSKHHAKKVDSRDILMLIAVTVCLVEALKI